MEADAGAEDGAFEGGGNVAAAAAATAPDEAVCVLICALLEKKTEGEKKAKKIYIYCSSYLLIMNAIRFALK